MMLIPFLVSKIQNASVTGLDPESARGIAMDGDILKKAGLREYQKVEVCNLNRGTHIETCVTALDGGTGEMVLTGNVATGAELGDTIIVVAYALLDELELNSRNAIFLTMKEGNQIDRIMNGKL